MDCPWDVSKPNGEVRFCTFSRVCKDKGITDAIEAVSMANSILGSDICRLDIYGTVDKSFSDEFYKLVEENAHCASYKGSVPADESVTAISCCAALLFPTYHDGFPGTVIDGLAAGVPIIAYEWDYAHYVIDEGLTGVIVPSCDIDALANVIVDFASSPSKYEYMRKNCLIAAEAYQPENAMKPIFDFIQQGSILATD
nr:glycosyltransferase [Gordonibacter massiliensis (ex Traore et al. 2017)]